MKLLKVFSSLGIVSVSVFCGLCQEQAVAEEPGIHPAVTSRISREKASVGVGSASSFGERTENMHGQKQEMKGDDREEADRRGRLFIVFLQMLRGPK